jgi:integrase
MKTQKSVYNLIFQNAIIDKNIGTILRINPVSEIKAPKSLKPAMKREAPEDDIVSAIRSSAKTDPFGLFPLLLISTGFRRGEALGLRWRNVDFASKSITQDRQIVYHGTTIEKEPKTENGIRTVPLLPDLEAVLKRPRNAKDSDFIFHGEDPAKPLCEASFRRSWQRYCSRMGFMENGKHTLTPHVFRHGYATMLFEADVDEFTAQKLLGHADINTTRSIYTHLRNKKKQESIDKLRQFVKCQIDT